MPRRRPTRSGERGRGSGRRPPVRLRYLLLGGGLAAVLAGLGLVATAAGAWLDRQLPVRRVLVDGDLTHQDPQALGRWLGRRIRGGILTIDLGGLRRAVRKRPWIRDARLRRQWPDAVALRVTEHVPAALWRPGEEADWRMVSREGVVFRPRKIGDRPGLPRLEGPASRLGRLRARRADLEDRLAGKHAITRLTVDARGAWSARVDQRIILRFGRRHWPERVKRLLRVQSQWSLLGERVERVDLRYPDGLAVAIAGQGKEGPGGGEPDADAARTAARR